MNSVDLPPGSSLLELENQIPFGCRAAACGRCRIEVTEGLDNLAPETPKEVRAKSILGIQGKQLRLACQVRVRGRFSYRLVSTLPRCV